MDDFVGISVVQLHDFPDIYVLNGALRFRIEAERPARGFQAQGEHGFSQCVFIVRTAAHGFNGVMKYLRGHVSVLAVYTGIDRESVVKGKRVSVIVDIGGRRYIKKKKKKV